MRSTLVWRSRLSACYKQRSSGLSVCGWGARDAHAHSIIPKVAYARVHSYVRDRLHVNAYTYVATTSPPRKHSDACDPPRRFTLFRPSIPYPASQPRYFIHARIVRPGLLLFIQVPRTFRPLSYTCTASILRLYDYTLLFFFNDILLYALLFLFIFSFFLYVSRQLSK